ncbi:MAG: hypothetical protein ACE15F_05645 [bacterium]
MKRTLQSLWIVWIGLAWLAGGGMPALAQSQPEPTPTPTVVPLSSACIDAGVDEENSLIRNGDFETGYLDSGLPPGGGWEPGDVPGVIQVVFLSNEKANHYLELPSGGSISQVPQSSSFLRFELSFCVVVPEDGILQITVGGQPWLFVPAARGAAYNGTYTGVIRANMSNSTPASERKIEFLYDGPGSALIDNVQLVYRPSGGEDEATPTPTVAVPTPTPSPQSTPASPTPTVPLGTPTPTPTPGLTEDSVQVIANPPMMLLSPDDFTGANLGQKKQITLDLQVVGSNGEKLDILKIDPDANVTFTVESRGDAAGVGVIQEFENNNYQDLNSRKKLKDVGQLHFVPLRPYNGTVRVIIEIEYKSYASGKEEIRKIRGVVPIFLRTDDRASLIYPTGTFDPKQNFNLGRKAGDRGYRPDMRTNLYFRERLQ